MTDKPQFHCGSDACCEGEQYPECCTGCDLKDALRYRQKPETD